MALFDDHIIQAKKNLAFLENINSNIEDCCDWQVTICFYCAVHLANAHLAKSELHYRRHNDVNHALNPEVALSTTKWSLEEFKSYIKLFQLSRRARYLVSESEGVIDQGRAFLTYDKHLARAVRHLDVLLVLFCRRYPEVTFKKISIKCIELKKNELKAIFIA